MPEPYFYNVVALFFIYNSDVYSSQFGAMLRGWCSSYHLKDKKGKYQSLWLKPELSEFSMHATSLYLLPV